MAKQGRIYTAAKRSIDPDRLYTPLEGVRLLKSVEGAKFDETVEVHFRLGVDVRALRGPGRHDERVACGRSGAHRGADVRAQCSTAQHSTSGGSAM